MPGKKPWVQVDPPFVEVAKPMSEEPPSEIRPVWNADTMVEPNAKVSGSTSVACWLLGLVKVSELSSMSPFCAWAAVIHSEMVITLNMKRVFNIAILLGAGNHAGKKEPPDMASRRQDMQVSSREPYFLDMDLRGIGYSPSKS